MSKGMRVDPTNRLISELEGPEWVRRCKQDELDRIKLLDRLHDGPPKELQNMRKREERENGRTY